MTDQTTLLSDRVRVVPHFRRSLNLEFDPLDAVADYIPTARAVETLRRMVSSASATSAPRAFALTGPYGSGKSSFGMFLDALVGPEGDASTAAARGILQAVDPDIASGFEAIVQKYAKSGLFRATATAQREPVAITIARALEHGAERFWGRGGPRTVRAAIASAIREPLGARDLATLVSTVGKHAPVLLVLDEFGKNLEHFSDSAAGDLFVLQELAERFGSANQSPGLLVTLQHVAFEQYATAAESSERREWIKVQGRFQEVSFVNDLDHASSLVSSALEQDASDPAFTKQLDRWAKAKFEECRNLGLVPNLVSSQEQVRGCYPINPLCMVILAELCQRFGQHDRTLFSFLASGEPSSLTDFLQKTPINGGTLPAISADAVWDYFLGSSATSVSGSTEGSRWLEISARVRDVRGLTALQERCAKTVGLLNLVGRGGTLRATPLIVAEALGMSDKRGRQQVAAALDVLRDSGVLVHREFADEYRIWQGTDFDIPGHLEAARSQLRDRPVQSLLATIQPVRPVVASRHSQQTGILRYFEIRFLGPDEALDTPASADADGLLIVSLSGQRPVLRALDSRPHVVVTMLTSNQLNDAALEAGAIYELLSTEADLKSDWVARRELQERAAVAVEIVREELAGLLAQTPTAWWIGHKNKLPGAGNLSRLLSAVCDHAYNKSPIVRNEMIARRELSSQGAKARRELLEAMLSAPTVEQLGLNEGFGPERAMYEALLRHTGLHTPGDEGWQFSPPAPKDSWRAAWEAIDAELASADGDGRSFQDLYDVLMAPPIGLKEGVIPVLLAAYVLARPDEVALYEDGTYKPVVDMSIFNRLVKTPARFQLRLVVTEGQRALVASLLLEAVGGRPYRRRNATILQAVGPLLGAVASLPPHAQRTQELSDDATRVRAALLNATDPAALLFISLPAACDIPEIAVDDPEDQASATLLIERITSAVGELQAAYERMLRETVTSIAEAFRLVPDLAELRSELRAHCRPLEGRVIDPSLRPFVYLALDDQFDDDIDWLEAILLSISGTPPKDWTDDDVRRFAMRLAELAGKFSRVRALHYATAATDSTGFDARRVTITAPDGSEVDDVYWVDASVRDAVLAEVDRVLERLEPALGSRALTSVIAALALRADAQRADSSWGAATAANRGDEEATGG